LLLFLAGLMVGVIFAVTLLAILNSGAIADQWMEATLKEMESFSLKRPNHNNN